MKKLLFLLFVPLLFLSCSNDDDDNNTTVTFLEKYNNTVWVLSDEDHTMYARFHNSISAPIEVWDSWDGCYYYEANVLEGYIILENSEEKFECRYTEMDGGVAYMDLLTIRISGETMVAESKYYEDDALIYSETQYFQKSTVNVDNLPLCD